MTHFVSGISRLLDPHTWSMNRVLKWLFFWIVLALALCVGFKSDTWWLLKAGEFTIRDGAIPLTNYHSWVFPDRYWPNHEWLTQVFFYLLYWIGGLPFLVVGIAAIITLSWLAVYRLCAGSPRWRIMVILLALIVNAAGWAVRPAMISQAFLLGFVALIPIRRLHWLYPLLMIIWANFHAGAVQGLVVLGSCGLAALLVERQSVVRWGIIGLLSALGVLLNPLGGELFVFASGAVGEASYTFIAEWIAPSIFAPRDWPFFLLVAITGVSIWLLRKRWHDHRDLAIIICTTIYAAMGIYSMRHIGIFAILAPLVITQVRPQTAIEPTVAPRQGRINQLLAVILAVFLLGLPIQIWSQRTLPIQASAITALNTCPEQTFNTYDDGGALIWFVPNRRVFIDNRNDPYPNDFIKAIGRAEIFGDYRELFQTYAIECAFVSKLDAVVLLEALQRDGWQLTYDDPTHALLRRP